MKPPVKLFVCEFITAGGFNHVDLPEKLACEGQYMRDALLQDLSSLSYQVMTTVDARLDLPKHCHGCVIVEAGNDVWQVWEAAIKVADMVWLIAPETDGVLYKLTALAARYNKLILGCGLDSIEVTSSKLATYHILDSADIANVPTYKLENWDRSKLVLAEKSAWILKPDDGAGCDETICFEHSNDLENWIKINHKESSHVTQPYQYGVPASISCVMDHGKAWVLSCNTQLIQSKTNQYGHKVLSYHGSIINGMRKHWTEFDSLANKIASVLPDLRGYVGIDVIVQGDEKSPHMIVMEINPRLTTSYAALAEATEANPAELTINTLTQKDYVWPTIQQNVVELHV